MYEKIIILLLICPVFLKAQKITENTYDKQDSSRVIKTNELVSNDVKVHCEYIDLQKIWFKSSNHYYSICIVFFDGGSNAVMGNDSLLKIEFTDGRIISYDKESYNIFVPFNYSNLTIKVKDS
ncbi:MAG: hypothetical protein IPP93_17415 [Chitinophagaceae bacterium]|nr:hypothetical protein [Chitinophagaceae bacterium]